MRKIDYLTVAQQFGDYPDIHRLCLLRGLRPNNLQLHLHDYAY
jgi:hypothetical protein